jgi:lipopolysaccharide export LptBFGC system permease protein LptF
VNEDRLVSPLIFRNTGGEGKIDRIAMAAEGRVEGEILILSDASVFSLVGAGMYVESKEKNISFSLDLADIKSLAEETRKPSHLSTWELELRIKQMEMNGDQTNATKAHLSLARRSVQAFAPLVMAIMAMPLAIAFGRRSALVSLCAAVLVGISFWGATSMFELLGTYGLLPIGIAAWGSTLVFGVLGFYLLSRTKS